MEWSEYRSDKRKQGLLLFRVANEQVVEHFEFIGKHKVSGGLYENNT